MAGRHNNQPHDETKRADNNRVKSISALRHLHRLMALAADPKFSGTIAVEISAKDGFYGRPKLTLVEYDSGSAD